MTIIGAMATEFYRQQVHVGRLPQPIRFKWGDALLCEGITAIPKQFLRTLSRVFNGERGVQQLQVALTLVDYLRPGMNPYPSIKFLAYMSGLEEAEFIGDLEALRERGLIAFERQGERVGFDVEGLKAAIARQSLSIATTEPKGGENVYPPPDDIPF